MASLSVDSSVDLSVGATAAAAAASPLVSAMALTAVLDASVAPTHSSMAAFSTFAMAMARAVCCAPFSLGATGHVPPAVVPSVVVLWVSEERRRMLSRIGLCVMSTSPFSFSPVDIRWLLFGTTTTSASA
eukprot:CAMPEP_0182570670 /NCGR_PEP_ID=MMETSP1324-20130603/10914_1 /TAXON_ID=236786 /ORGANISM="Florenciella sp., Strain RCC1587" /LENGTH=129 /DNA_ID=CAMNT_0024785089 /DNA_START=13 /DNA_END=399 /DNA_ORIENTATION=-